MTTAWTADDLARLPANPPATPSIGFGDWPVVIPGQVLWDPWPVTDLGGLPTRTGAGEFWMALSAQVDDDPLARHARARIRLLGLASDAWRDFGDAMPDRHSSGSREWSGSAVLASDGRLTLYFTAAGRRGEPRITVEQRLFECRARLSEEGGLPRLVDWTPPVESVAADGETYLRADQAWEAVGTIRAFRDPFWFRNPADGSEHLLFAASMPAGSSSNGAVGRAERRGGRWRLRPPLIHAVGVNNELERPHVVMRDNAYYLFWSTQRAVFAPGLAAPTGLYGMFAPRLTGPYRPLNGSGLVIANPELAPDQAYGWHVLPDLRVASFVDHAGDGPDAIPAFVGAPAPMLRLSLRADEATLA